jgi:hypothetical protein
MSRDEKEICLYCRWWKPLDYYQVPGEEAHTTSPGECRVGRPVLMQWGGPSEGLEAKSSWPRTLGGDFCGEFTSRRDDQYEHVKGEFIAGVGMTYRRADGSHTEECRCRWCAEAVLRGTAEPKSFDNWTTLGEASNAAIKGLKE